MATCITSAVSARPIMQTVRDVTPMAHANWERLFLNCPAGREVRGIPNFSVSLGHGDTPRYGTGRMA